MAAAMYEGWRRYPEDDPRSVSGEFWIGAWHAPAPDGQWETGWQWVTGEEWTFSAWLPGHPSSGYEEKECCGVVAGCVDWRWDAFPAVDAHELVVCGYIIELDTEARDLDVVIMQLSAESISIKTGSVIGIKARVLNPSTGGLVNDAIVTASFGNGPQVTLAKIPGLNYAGQYQGTWVAGAVQKSFRVTVAATKGGTTVYDSFTCTVWGGDLEVIVSIQNWDNDSEQLTFMFSATDHYGTATGTVQKIVNSGTASWDVTNAAGQVEAQGEFEFHSEAERTQTLGLSGHNLAVGPHTLMLSVMSDQARVGPDSDTFTRPVYDSVLGGTVTEKESGDPASGATVYLYDKDAVLDSGLLGADMFHWRDVMERCLPVRQAAAGSDGKYSFGTVPPRRYKLIALWHPEETLWYYGENDEPRVGLERDVTGDIVVRTNKALTLFGEEAYEMYSEILWDMTRRFAEESRLAKDDLDNIDDWRETAAFAIKLFGLVRSGGDLIVQQSLSDLLKFTCTALGLKLNADLRAVKDAERDRMLQGFTESWTVLESWFHGGKEPMTYPTLDLLMAPDATGRLPAWMVGQKSLLRYLSDWRLETAKVVADPEFDYALAWEEMRRLPRRVSELLPDEGSSKEFICYLGSPPCSLDPNSEELLSFYAKRRLFRAEHENYENELNYGLVAAVVGLVLSAGLAFITCGASLVLEQAEKMG